MASQLVVEILRSAGVIQGNQSYTDRATMSDDTAIAAANPSVGSRYAFMIVVSGQEFLMGVNIYQSISVFNSSAFSNVAGNGTLGGTTGPDGTMNVRANNSTLYIENRRGSVRNVGWFLFSLD